jgi:hypothetical protein
VHGTSSLLYDQLISREPQVELPCALRSPSSTEERKYKYSGHRRPQLLSVEYTISQYGRADAHSLDALQSLAQKTGAQGLLTPQEPSMHEAL